jgi:hypothetical protein
MSKTLTGSDRSRKETRSTVDEEKKKKMMMINSMGTGSNRSPRSQKGQVEVFFGDTRVFLGIITICQPLCSWVPIDLCKWTHYG